MFACISVNSSLLYFSVLLKICWLETSVQYTSVLLYQQTQEQFLSSRCETVEFRTIIILLDDFCERHQVNCTIFLNIASGRTILIQPGFKVEYFHPNCNFH